MPRFRDAISGKENISIIAEIKRYSPSHGRSFPFREVPDLVSMYEKGGASALSVVTAKEPFQGSLELLKEARSLTKLPLIRKDFITTVPDLDESKTSGADAVLLIAHRLTKESLYVLVKEALARDLDPVVELHFDEDFKKIEALIKNPADIIVGINNRNLENFKTDVQHAAKLLGQLDPACTIIAESAFQMADDFAPYKGKIDAVLIGTALLTAKDPMEKLLSFTAEPLKYNTLMPNA